VPHQSPGVDSQPLYEVTTELEARGITVIIKGVQPARMDLPASFLVSPAGSSSLWWVSLRALRAFMTGEQRSPGFGRTAPLLN
jgi:hypothetical protein